MLISSAYLGSIFDPTTFKIVFERTLVKAREIHQKFLYDAIAFTGMSGAAMAFPLSLHMGMPLICVRKEGTSHYQKIGFGNIEGVISASNKFLFVDDFIDSGETLNRVLETVSGSCVAVLLYNSPMCDHYRGELPVFVAGNLSSIPSSQELI